MLIEVAVARYISSTLSDLNQRTDNLVTWLTRKGWDIEVTKDPIKIHQNENNAPILRNDPRNDSKQPSNKDFLVSK